MANYLSFDASVKIHYSGRWSSTKSNKSGFKSGSSGFGAVRGFSKHLDRQSDRKDGIEWNHFSNPDINSDLTDTNVSYYKDENGWARTEHSSDMVKAVERRINYARDHGARIYDGSSKNDTVIVRALIFQLDEGAIEGHDNWMWDLVSLAEERFGDSNICSFSLHADETSKHIHVLMTPVVEEKDDDGKIHCRISQTEFFKSPAMLSAMHRSMRQELIDKGYDISLDNKPLEEDAPNVFVGSDGELKKGKGVSTDVLKKLSARKKQIEEEEVAVNMMEKEVNAKAKANEKEAEKIQAEEERLRSEKHKVAEVAQSNRIARQNANRVHKQSLQKQEDEKEEKKSEMELLMRNEEFRKFMDYCKSVKTNDGTMYDFLTKLVERYDKKKRAEEADLAIRTEKILEIGAEAEALENQKFGQNQQKENASLGLEELNPFDL